MNDNLGPISVELFTERNDFLSRDAGFLFSPLGSVGFKKCPLLGNPGHPFLDEILVVQIFFNNIMGNTEQQGIVGTRLDLPVTGRFGCCIGNPGINIGNTCAVIHTLEKRLDLFHLQRFCDNPAKEHDMAGIFKIVGKSLSAKAVNRLGGVINITAAGTVMVHIVG